MVDPLTQFQEDVVADVLQSIHLQSALYCRAHLSAPWGLGIPRREVATFHIVTAGACRIRAPRLTARPAHLGSAAAPAIQRAHD